MLYGWVGTDLEVDLTKGKVEKVKGAPELLRNFLGGKGIGAKLLWDRVPPETTRAYSPENQFVISNGLLTGTPVPSANRCVMSFISPLTDLYYYASMGGFFATELKHAGYDNVIIGGKSPTPVYLWINDGQVEIRDASHLWGKATYETREMIRQELENEKVQIACIGPAGENRVHAAAVQASHGASFSRAGAGALWGDKKLKAIAIYGNNNVSMANPAKLYELCDYILERSKKLREIRHAPKKTFLDIINRGQSRYNWYGNFNELDYRQLPPDSPLKQEVDKIEEKFEELLAKKGARLMSCYNCMVQCRQAFEYQGGLTFLKCSSLVPFLVFSKYFDYDWALDCYNWAEEMGADIFSLPRLAALTIDLYQRGILTKADTDGMHLEFGNPEVFKTLMEKIVQREGIGDVVANGAVKAAKQIGKGAEEYVHTIKGLEMRLSAALLYDPTTALANAIHDKSHHGGNITGVLQAWANPREANELRTKEAREKYAASDWFQYPKEYAKYFVADYPYDGLDYEGGCQLNSYDVERWALTDSLGVCHFQSGFSRYGPLESRSLQAELITNVTGLDIDEAKATQTANRIVNLIRAYTRRCGLSRKDDTLPKIFFEQNPVPPQQRLSSEILNKWLDRFYELRGWDKEGAPTKDTLEKVGLGYVWEKLKKCGVVTEGEVLTGLRRDI